MAYQTDSPFGVDVSGSGSQQSSDWVSVKSKTYDHSSKPVYTYSTNKPPIKYVIRPKIKNKPLPPTKNSNGMIVHEVKAQEPNSFRHANPSQDPTATFCPVCNNKFRNSWITVDGCKIHKGCFKCSKCKKTLNHKLPNSYSKLNGFTLHFRDKYVCNDCKVQSNYGVYGQCTACKKVLPSVYFEDSDGYKYHNECFNCMECGKSLANFNERYFSVSGKDRYCKQCRQKQAYANK